MSRPRGCVAAEVYQLKVDSTPSSAEILFTTRNTFVEFKVGSAGVFRLHHQLVKNRPKTVNSKTGKSVPPVSAPSGVK